MDTIKTPLTLADIETRQHVVFCEQITPEITNGFSLQAGEITISGNKIIVQDIAFNRTFHFEIIDEQLYHSGSPCYKLELDSEAIEWLTEAGISLD